MTIELVEDLVTVKVSNQEPRKEAGYRLNGKVWTRAQSFVHWSDAVQYCADRGVRLQTLDDAVEFRHDTQGVDHSNNSQHTGTFIAYVNDGRTGLRAHVYEPTAEELLRIVAQVGGVRFLDVATTSDLGKRVLKFSDSSGRTFVVPASDTEESVQADENGSSPYSTNEYVRKLMPRNAVKNAAVIQRNGCTTTGEVWFYRPTLSKDKMRILPVSLGADSYSVIDCVVDDYSHFSFYYGSPARGLVQTGVER